MAQKPGVSGSNHCDGQIHSPGRTAEQGMGGTGGGQQKMQKEGH